VATAQERRSGHRLRAPLQTFLVVLGRRHDFRVEYPWWHTYAVGHTGGDIIYESDTGGGTILEFGTGGGTIMK